MTARRLEGLVSAEPVEGGGVWLAPGPEARTERDMIVGSPTEQEMIVGSPTQREIVLGSAVQPTVHPRRARRLGLIAGNVAGAAFAVYLLLPNLRFFVQTGRPIGLVFTVQLVWVGVVCLTRRPPKTVTRRPLDWIAAYAGWFTSFLIRPGGYHLAWGVAVGFWVQVAGLLLWAWAFSKLARSYGVVAADRGLATRGPYAVVRHPLYSAYILGGIGYLMQSLSVWNVVVDLISVGWQLVRIRAEERHLQGADYAAYRAGVHWRLFPGLW